MVRLSGLFCDAAAALGSTFAEMSRRKWIATAPATQKIRSSAGQTASLSLLGNTPISFFLTKCSGCCYSICHLARRIQNAHYIPLPIILPSALVVADFTWEVSEAIHACRWSFCFATVTFPQPLGQIFFFFYEVTWKKREVLWYLLNVFYGRSLRSVCVSFKLQNSPVKRGLHYLGFTNTEMESHRGLVNFFLPDNIFKNSLKMWQERVTTMLLKSTDTVAEYVLIQSICWETRNGRNSCMIGSQWDCCLKKSKPEGSMVFQNAQRWELLQN